MGKNPKWKNNIALIKVQYLGEDVHFNLWDYNSGFCCSKNSDTLIGDCVFKFTELTKNDALDGWFEVFYKFKVIGEIHIRCEWKPN